MAYSPNTADIVNLILQGSANVEQIIRANTLDEMGEPAANVLWNNKRLLQLANGIASVSSTEADAANINQLAPPNQMAYVASGCVWTADSPGSSLNCSMTAGTVVINGLPLSVAAVTSRAFTANDDTYIDLANNGDGTASITYTTVPNWTMSPALANSGTMLNTIRVGVISAGASAVASTGIIQGSLGTNVGGGTNAGTQPSTTVAAGSNGNTIATTPLDVASSSSFQSGGGWAQVAHSAGQTYTIAYTGTGSGTLTGVTVISGTTTNTVSTSDTVKGIWPVGVQDMLGNRIYPTTPLSGLVGGLYYSNAFTSTLTGPAPLPGTSSPGTKGFSVPFIIPPGAPRNVKVTFQTPAWGSSAAAGTQINTNTVLGNAGGGGVALGTASGLVNVSSDFIPLQLSGLVNTALLAPGSYTAQVAFSQGAAGTYTAGSLLLFSYLFVELV